MRGERVCQASFSTEPSEFCDHPYRYKDSSEAAEDFMFGCFIPADMVAHEHVFAYAVKY